MLKTLWNRWRRPGLVRLIERHGWTALYVGDYAAGPAWAYTIGFRATLGAPEVIVFDIPQASANALFHEIFRQLKAGELVITDGAFWTPEDGRQVWRKVHHSRYADDEEPWLGLALTFGHVLSPEAGEFEAYQLVLSDAEARLPWEAGYDERLRPRQPALYEPPL